MSLYYLESVLINKLSLARLHFQSDYSTPRIQNYLQCRVQVSSYVPTCNVDFHTEPGVRMLAVMLPMSFNRNFLRTNFEINLRFLTQVLDCSLGIWLHFISIQVGPLGKKNMSYSIVEIFQIIYRLPTCQFAKTRIQYERVSRLYSGHDRYLGFSDFQVTGNLRR